MSLIYILYVVLGVGLLILIHEFGHFLFAKRYGVRVEIFSIGFGPRLFGWRRDAKGKVRFSLGALESIPPGTEDHTDYRVSLIPLGGYVKMAGEEPSDEHTGASWEFSSKTVGERAMIVVAGVVFNTILALVLFILAFQLGVRFTYNEVGYVEHGKAAWKAGLDPGDKILAIDGFPTEDFDDIATTIAFTERPCELKVLREGKVLTIRVTPEYEPRLGFPTIGIGVKHGLEVQNILQLTPEVAPAKDAGLQPDDRIVAVAPFVVKTQERLYRLLWSFPERSLDFELEGKKLSLSLGEWIHGQRPKDVQNLKFLGVSLHSWQELRRVLSRFGNTELPLVVERQGEKKVLSVVPAILPSWRIGVEKGGELVVEGVRQGTLASEYFQEGDLILEVNGQKLKHYGELLDVLAKAQSEELTWKVKRKGQTVSFSIPLAKVRSYWILRSGSWDKGLKLTALRRSSPLRDYLQKGERIVAVGTKKVSSFAELTEALASVREKTYFVIERNGRQVPTPWIYPDELNLIWLYQGLVFPKKAVIGKVIPHFPAEKAGLKSGDQIVAINGSPIETWGEMAYAIQMSQGKTLEIRVLRQGKQVTVKVQPIQAGLQVRHAIQGLPFQREDTLLLVDGAPLTSLGILRKKLQGASAPLQVTFFREGKIQSVNVSPEKLREVSVALLGGLALRDDAKVGIRPKVARFYHRVPSLWQSMVLGCKKSYIFVKRIFLTLKSVLTARVSAKNLGGPVLIAQASYSLAKQGVGTLLYFLGILSLNLAVLNILPIPLLDGGHLVFLGIEKIKGSRVSEEVIMVANYIGLVLLLMLMIFVTYNDIMRLLR